MFRKSLLIAAAFLILTLAPSAARACQPEWSMIADADDQILAITIYDDGFGPELYVAGEFSTIDGVSAIRIARFNGSTWEAVPGDDFLGGVSLRVQDMEVYQGELYICGTNFPDNFDCNEVARFNGNFWDVIFGDCGIANAKGMLANTDGLYIAGAGTPTSPGLVLWNGLVSDSLWTMDSLDVGSLAGETYVARSGAGGLYRVDGGNFVEVATNRLLPSLTTWNGVLYAGGNYSGIGNELGANNIAGWNGTTWARLGAGTDDEVTTIAAVESGIMNGLYVGGLFSLAGSISAQRIAKWNGTFWESLGAGLPGSPNRVYAAPNAVYASVGNSLYVWQCPGGPNDCDGDGTDDSGEPDFDGDGIIDDCDSDSDGDGVANGDDVCPFTAIGLDVDSDGRPIGDMNQDCITNGVDIQLFVDTLLDL